jgi:polyhydroxybutyrate depolymerase
MVFNFPGYTRNATEQLWYGDFGPIADMASFFVVHPEGTLLNGESHWNVGGGTLGSTMALWRL